MPINVAWDNPEQTVLRFYMTGGWTWDECECAKVTTNAMLDALVTPRCVGVMVVIDKEIHFPPNMLAIAHRHLLSKHNNIGLVVIVSGNFLIKAMLNTLLRLEPSLTDSIQHVPTIEQGRRRILEYLSGM